VDAILHVSLAPPPLPLPPPPPPYRKTRLQHQAWETPRTEATKCGTCGSRIYILKNGLMEHVVCGKRGLEPPNCKPAGGGGAKFSGTVVSDVATSVCTRLVVRTHVSRAATYATSRRVSPTASHLPIPSPRTRAGSRTHLCASTATKEQGRSGEVYRRPC
jgi:hypothetical protein